MGGSKIGTEDTNGGADEMMMRDTVDKSAKYGMPHEFDPDFKGPIDKRGCTDVLCLGLFVFFLIGWAVVAVIAFRQGDPSVLVHPVDSWGQKCGLDPSVANKSYLYFFDITKCATPKVLLTGCRTPQVCVEECPNFGPWTPQMDITRGATEEQVKAKMICQYGVDRAKYNVKELMDKQLCARYVLPADPKNYTRQVAGGKGSIRNVKSILAKRCIPNVLNKEDMKQIESEVKTTNLIAGVNKLIELLNAKQNFEYLFEDFQASWHIMALLLVIGATASLIWICLMRCFAGVMVWLSLIGSIGVLSFGCYFSVVKYLQLKSESAEQVEAYELRSKINADELEQLKFITTEDLENQLDTYLKLKDTWLVFAIITGSVLTILLLLIFVLRSRLSIAVGLIKQSARAVSDMVFTLFWPIAPWILQLFGIGFFLLVGIYLVSASEEVYHVMENCTCNGTNEILLEETRCNLKKFASKCGLESDCVIKNACRFTNYQKLTNVGWLHLYNFFGIIWLLCFIEDFDDMVLAGSFAGWYWTFDRKKNLDLFPVTNSLIRTTRYHLGTIAFGSLIISVIKFIRYLLEYVDYKLREYGENPIAKAILCCCKCCFWCLEKFMKYINRNAYIMTAIYGKNFCTSAKDAFFLLMRNAVRAFVLDKVTDFLLFIGKLLIVGGVALASFYYFSRPMDETVLFNEKVPVLHFYLMPVIVVTVGTYFIASLFFSVYNMAVDTLFLCFLEDSERNDGSEEKPYYMPKELMEILGKRNKPPESAKSS